MAGAMTDERIEFDLDSVLSFVKSILPGFDRSERMRAIGLRRHGALVAGVVFDGFNGRNIWMHVAAVPGGEWLVRAYLMVCFAYPFELCGVDRISGYVDASNAMARRFDEHLGFREEARLAGAAADGGDVILYVMRRADCRYLRG